LTRDLVKIAGQNAWVAHTCGPEVVFDTEMQLDVWRGGTPFDLPTSRQAAGQAAQWDADFPGFRRIYAHDPFGNRLEFLEPSP
jgi:hypothetical protein